MVLDDAAAVRRHIEHKSAMRELHPDVAARMLSALDEGAAPDYAALLEAATFLPPPTRVYHSTSVDKREQILSAGLRPGTGENWGDKAVGQPEGVYVAPNPDERGIWSHWEEWDIWAIDMTDLSWTHDRLNPGNSEALTAALFAAPKEHNPRTGKWLKPTLDLLRDLFVAHTGIKP